MNYKKLFVLLAISAFSFGCASTYTSIQPAGGNAYYLTRTHQGFFTVSGALYWCTAEGKRMVCTEVDSQ